MPYKVEHYSDASDPKSGGSPAGHIAEPSRGEDIYLISILYIHSLFYIYVHLFYTYILFFVVIVMLCCTRYHRSHIQMVRTHYGDMLQR